jgi:aerobic-type carbon monoxide dehydrogenase small subunit (CoxS/CutS family)
MSISIRVNHRLYEISIDDTDTPLLYVLRDYLGLKGTRFGCGTGDCGACMVLVDGHAQRSCELPVGSVVGRPITTIGGLGVNTVESLPEEIRIAVQTMLDSSSE